MTSPQAILAGAVLIAAAVYLSNGSEAVSQATVASGGYMAVAGDDSAYEFDTVTGAIRSCVRQAHGTDGDRIMWIMSCSRWTAH